MTIKYLFDNNLIKDKDAGLLGAFEYDQIYVIEYLLNHGIHINEQFCFISKQIHCIVHCAIFVQNILQNKKNSKVKYYYIIYVIIFQ